jgi:DME family drug/metabolite transporter
VRRRHLPLVLVNGLVSVGAFYFLYMEAVERLPVAVAAALLYTAPAFVVALSWLLGWEPPRAGRLLPLGMVLAGAFLVTGAWSALAGGTSPAGAAFGLASGIAYALYTVLGKRLRRHYDVAATIFWAYGIGAAVLALAAPPWRVLVEHPSAWPVILLMALGPTLLAVVLFYAGVHRIDASTASMLATVEPVVAAAVGVAWLGEGLAAATWAGTALILAAALLLAPRRAVPDPRPG